MSARIAVVGCGAIARSFHLPALAAIPGVADRLIVVDPDPGRVAAAQQEFRASRAATDHRQVLREADAAIVAVPQEFHAEVAMEFLRAGVPVLCEKPLATTLDEAKGLLAAADAAGVVLAVNNTRRFYPAVRAAREWIGSGRLGRIRRVAIHEGAAFNWPLASGGTFGRGGTGKGVLQDVGAHALDMICWWLGERPRITRYVDDAMGGSEAVARVEFAGDGYSGVVHLSWLSRLPNAFRIEGEDASVEGGILAWDAIRLNESGGRSRRVRLRRDVRSFPQVKDHVIANFLGAVRGECRPIVSGRDVLPSIAMIEECYGRRERFLLPWFHAVPEVSGVAV
ncbi:MAG TPA: Gfo/Idh/MocA family oxidoreductase [bacterium]